MLGSARAKIQARGSHAPGFGSPELLLFAHAGTGLTMIPDIHVHTSTCFKENMSCAQARIEELERELGECRTTLAKYQIVLRDMGGILDKMETAFGRVLNMNGKR